MFITCINPHPQSVMGATSVKMYAIIMLKDLDDGNRIGHQSMNDLCRLNDEAAGIVLFQFNIMLIMRSLKSGRNYKCN